MTDTRGDRLKQARKAAGFASSKAAAEAMNIPPATLNAHERAQAPGGRDFGPDEAKRYGRKFKVEDIWLLTGKGKGPGGKVSDPDADPHIESGEIAAGLDRQPPATAPLVGYVGAGAQAHFYAISQGDLDQVPAPAGSTKDTVLLEIRGQSLGKFMDRWHVAYDDVRSPVTDDLLNEICVVGLANDQVLIKHLSRKNGKFILQSQSDSEPPIEGADIVWAAKVKTLVAR